MFVNGYENVIWQNSPTIRYLEHLIPSHDRPLQMELPSNGTVDVLSISDSCARPFAENDCVMIESSRTASETDPCGEVILSTESYRR